MNRRNLLKGLLGVGVGGAAVKAIAEEDNGYRVEFDPEQKRVKDLYWESQYKIQEYEAELEDHRITLAQYDPEPGDLRFNNGERDVAIMKADGQHFVIQNPITGRKIVI